LLSLSLSLSLGLEVEQQEEEEEEETNSIQFNSLIDCMDRNQPPAPIRMKPEGMLFAFANIVE
jgi:hypothetical protein